MTDIELWKGLKREDKAALEQLFLRYYDDLFRYAVKFCGDETVAEDHIQDLFLRIWKRRDNLGQVTGVKTYLWTALRRSLIVYQRNRQREAEVYSVHEEEGIHMEFAVEEVIIAREKDSKMREALEQALNELSPRQREIIYLRYYHGMSYDEVEAITSLNYQTLRNHTHRALKVLESVIRNHTTGVLLTMMFIQLVNVTSFLPIN